MDTLRPDGEVIEDRFTIDADGWKCDVAQTSADL
jgi:hypothetical protein